ncbi:hypothetical protein PAPYR_4611 [Paratrimastix pyriformis]|uniref:Uncharacterized protein n=1 Tax=Paratrimastix pyriformis TaxID=342808 RepID=A0ABQ8ULK0_9EUKA|nr:hypothetical protein PAPYR_4611 [Paratrimastix pyriformis]
MQFPTPLYAHPALSPSPREVAQTQCLTKSGILKYIKGSSSATAWLSWAPRASPLSGHPLPSTPADLPNCASFDPQGYATAFWGRLFRSLQVPPKESFTSLKCRVPGHTDVAHTIQEWLDIKLEGWKLTGDLATAAGCSMLDFFPPKWHSELLPAVTGVTDAQVVLCLPNRKVPLWHVEVNSGKSRVDSLGQLLVGVFGSALGAYLHHPIAEPPHEIYSLYTDSQIALFLRSYIAVAVVPGRPLVSLVTEPLWLGGSTQMVR